MRIGIVGLVLAMVVGSWAGGFGCGESSSKSTGVGGSGGNVGGSLFTDPAVPTCTAAKNVALRGTLGGQAVDDATVLTTYLLPNSYEVWEVIDDEVRVDVALTWDAPLVEGTAIPLTGESFIMREGQPRAGESFCITAGLFGSPALKAGDPGRTLIYRITGARQGDCYGPEIAVDLYGCALRTEKELPGGGSGGSGGTTGSGGASGVDGGADGAAGVGGATGAAGASGDKKCEPDGVPDAAASECNTFPITGPWCDPEKFTSADGGVVGDGGFEGPMGGTLVDGHYELVRYRTVGSNRTQRNIRVMNGGTRIEWAVRQEGGGGVGDVRLSSTISRSGNTLNLTTVTCGSLSSGYGYTASGTDLVLYNGDPAGTGALINVYTYRRTCRP